ncbi:extracellular solute-binding protein, partial [Streptomyces flavofungini]|uniref:extracellular solute-binding protein n=1 Tax=Streptomyces flavofungini TaxID=68200 RepID=UPI0034DF0192
LFDGSYGRDVLADAVRRLGEAYPHVDVGQEFAQDLGRRVPEELAGDAPPDLIQYSGGGTENIKSLGGKGMLRDLGPLLDAPAIDSPGKKVRDLLLPGVADAGRSREGGPVHSLNYVLTVYGFWYSRTALRGLGKSYPRTFKELIAICEAAERRGMAGLVFPGKYPYYLWFTVAASVAKRGGKRVLDALVANEPGAWRARAVLDVFEAYAELGRRGHVLKESAEYDHIAAQKQWTEGKALLIPNGSWLETESEPPEGFDPAVGPPPGVSGDDRLPFGTLAVNFGEPFVVPDRAKNPEAAMELLRIMLGPASAERFAVRRNALPAVRGAGAWQGLKPGAESAIAAYEGAKGNAFHWNGFAAGGLQRESGEALGEVLLGRATPDEAVDRVQRAADRL